MGGMVGEGMQIVDAGKYLKPMSVKDIPTRPSVIVVNRHYITPSPPPEVEILDEIMIVGGDVEVEQSLSKHRVKGIAEEILDEVDGKSVGRGGENIAQKKGGKVPCEEE